MAKPDTAHPENGSFSFPPERSSFFGLPRPSLDVSGNPFWPPDFDVKLGSIDHGSTLPTPAPEVRPGQDAPSLEREARWADVRRLCTVFQKLVPESVPPGELSKAAFYEMYNTAVSLVRAVDALDPEKQLVTARGSAEV